MFRRTPQGLSSLKQISISLWAKTRLRRCNKLIFLNYLVIIIRYRKRCRFTKHLFFLHYSTIYLLRHPNYARRGHGDLTVGETILVFARQRYIYHLINSSVKLGFKGLIKNKKRMTLFLFMSSKDILDAKVNAKKCIFPFTAYLFSLLRFYIFIISTNK